MKECFKNTHALTFPNEYCSKFLNGTNVTKLCKVSQLEGGINWWEGSQIFVDDKEGQSSKGRLWNLIGDFHAS